MFDLGAALGQQAAVRQGSHNNRVAPSGLGRGVNLSPRRQAAASSSGGTPADQAVLQQAWVLLSGGRAMPGPWADAIAQDTRASCVSNNRNGSKSFCVGIHNLGKCVGAAKPTSVSAAVMRVLWGVAGNHAQQAWRVVRKRAAADKVELDLSTVPKSPQDLFFGMEKLPAVIAGREPTPAHYMLAQMQLRVPPWGLFTNGSAMLAHLVIRNPVMFYMIRRQHPQPIPSLMLACVVLLVHIVTKYGVIISVLIALVFCGGEEVVLWLRAPILARRRLIACLSACNLYLGRKVDNAREGTTWGSAALLSHPDLLELGVTLLDGVDVAAALDEQAADHDLHVMLLRNFIHGFKTLSDLQPHEVAQIIAVALYSVEDASPEAWEKAAATAVRATNLGFPRAGTARKQLNCTAPALTTACLHTQRIEPNVMDAAVRQLGPEVVWSYAAEQLQEAAATPDLRLALLPDSAPAHHKHVCACAEKLQQYILALDRAQQQQQRSSSSLPDWMAAPGGGAAAAEGPGGAAAAAAEGPGASISLPSALANHVADAVAWREAAVAVATASGDGVAATLAVEQGVKAAEEDAAAATTAAAAADGQVGLDAQTGKRGRRTG